MKSGRLKGRYLRSGLIPSCVQPVKRSSGATQRGKDGGVLAGDYAAAQALFEQLAKDVPLAGVINNIGVCQSKRNLPEALATIEQAIDDDPGDAAMQFNAGFVLWKQARFEKAAVHFREALDRDGSDAESKQLLDRCQKKNGPRPRERIEIQERVKTEYEEAAYLQLKSVLQSNGKP